MSVQWLMRICLSLLLLLSGIRAAQAESAFDACLAERYLSSGWQADCISQCGDAGAAVLSMGDQRLLVAMKGSAVCENALAAAYYETSICVDTEDLLYLTIASDREATTYDFHFSAGQWLLSGIRHITPGPWEGDGSGALQETILHIADESLRATALIEDENENILWQNNYPPFPNVLTDEDLDLANWAPFDCVVFCSGYSDLYLGTSADSIRSRLFDALKAGTPYSSYRYADGLIGRSTVQFIADRPDGVRVLLCGSWEESLGWVFVESTPLPAGTTMGVDNLTENLLFPGQQVGPSIQRFADGTWGVGRTMSYSMGQNWICSEYEPLRGAQVCYGAHPWSDITTIDWTSLPATCAEAQAMMDLSHWATPNNANPADRLHLRSEPDRSGRSLGKFYNGTPVEVLAKGAEWSHVRIGYTEGYMMTRYLAFGEDMLKVRPYYSSKTPRKLLTSVELWLSRQDRHAVLLPTEACSLFIVIGLADEEWWVVWDPFSNRFGRINDQALWDGNG